MVFYTHTNTSTHVYTYTLFSLTRCTLLKVKQNIHVTQKQQPPPNIFAGFKFGLNSFTLYLWQGKAPVQTPATSWGLGYAQSALLEDSSVKHAAPILCDVDVKTSPSRFSPLSTFTQIIWGYFLIMMKHNNAYFS